MPRGLPPWKKFGGSTIVGGSVLNQDFKEFIQSLNDNGVRYLVVGGYAVALHGYPRYTKDMDIWVEVTPENASNIVKAIDQFGFGSLGVKEADFIVSNQMLQLGYPPGRIDILTTLPGVDFSECYPVRTTIEIDGVSVNFIALRISRRTKKHQADIKTWLIWKIWNSALRPPTGRDYAYSVLLD
jgi:hypothetical protein